MAPTMTPRITDLRDNLVSLMPIRKAADQAKLAGEYITTVPIQYLTWQARLIRPRPRSVVIWPEVLASPHYAVHQTDVERLRAEFEAGVDVMPPCRFKCGPMSMQATCQRRRRR